MRKNSKWMTKLAIVGALSAATAAVTLPGAPAEAAGLRARVYLTQARVPRRTSERGLVRFARGHLSRRLRETTDKDLNDRKWLANMVTAFNRSPNDLEFTVLIYDIDGNDRDFVDSMNIFTADRDQKTFVSKLKLERPKFKPNHKHELVVTVRRREVGKFRFWTKGEEKRNTGVVSFSEDET